VVFEGGEEFTSSERTIANAAAKLKGQAVDFQYIGTVIMEIEPFKETQPATEQAPEPEAAQVPIA
jgi:hypothetical protein